jgi:hypothetical protein
MVCSSEAVGNGLRGFAEKLSLPQPDSFDGESHLNRTSN